MESLYELCKFKLLKIYKNGKCLTSLHLPNYIIDDLIEDHICHITCNKYKTRGYFINYMEECVNLSYVLYCSIIVCWKCNQSYQLKGEYFERVSDKLEYCNLCKSKISILYCNCF